MAPVQYHTGKFPPINIDWAKLVPLIGPTTAALSRFDGAVRGIPSPSVLLSPLTVQESVLSSKIEGTRTTFEEFLELEAEGDFVDDTTEERKDFLEIVNYRDALSGATANLDKLPLSQRLLKQTHKILMRGVRGKSKAPGEYRRVPAWIGEFGSTVDDCRFVPTDADLVPDAMSKWEAFVHDDTFPDKLVQLAVIHAEFEAIHPFLDGNGRLGRLMVPLFLHEKGLLGYPNFYISGYLESHRQHYYDLLLGVSSKGDWTSWCAFFLEGIRQQAELNFQKANAMLALHEEKRGWLADATHSQHSTKAIDWLFHRPVFKATDFVQNAGINDQTARRILQIAEDGGLVQKLRQSAGRRAAIYCVRELLSITEGNHFV